MKKKNILFIHHSPSENTKKLSKLVENKIKNTTPNANLKILNLIEANTSSFIETDGLIIGTTENFGYVSGLTKDFFDRCYNIRLESSKNLEEEPEKFFTGIPTPVGAILILLPLTHSFMGYYWAYENLNFVAAYIILISGLLTSRIPTFSIKRKNLYVKSRIIFFIAISLIVLSLINFLWLSINILAFIYLLTIPFSIYAWNNTLNKSN